MSDLNDLGAPDFLAGPTAIPGQPGFEELVAERFPKFYEEMVPLLVDVKFEAMTGCCDRCGVAPEDPDAHLRWHRNVTLGINFAQQMASRCLAVITELAAEVERLDKEEEAP